MIYVFLATGFEDIEALAPLDILRRAGLQVETVSITGEEIVTSAHGVGVVADTLIEAVDFEDAEMIVLPGGMPGASNLDACEVLRQGILSHCKAGKPLAAICAAPSVLGDNGLVQGKKCTCYPGFESHLTGGNVTTDKVAVDGKIITSRGPATAIPFALKIIELLVSREKAIEVGEDTLYL